MTSLSVSSHPGSAGSVSHAGDTRLVADFLRRRADAEWAATDRRVLTRDEAIALARTVLKMRTAANDPSGRAITIQHRVVRVVRMTRNTHVTSADLDFLTLNFSTAIGSGIPVDVETTVRDVATLQEVVRRAEVHASPALRAQDINPDADAPWMEFQGFKTYLPVSLWHPATQDALAAPAHGTAARMMTHMRDSGFTCAGTIALMTRAYLAFHEHGKQAWVEDTDSEVTMTAFAPDGSASGWSGQAERNWANMQPERIVTEAIDMAARNRGRVRVEPGRYTAILSPAAVGSLISEMCILFHPLVGGPFVKKPGADGRKTKLGQKMVDQRISMWTDPADPNYGNYPFFDDGYPSGKVTWIDHGIVKALAYDPGYGAMEGQIPFRCPPSIQMSGGSTSIEQMIAQCDRGIYVHRLSAVRLMDEPSAMMMGNTRDGCFFIKNGKIQHPAVNFRFYESPMLLFNKLVAMGTPKRAAFGFGNDRRWGTIDGWPREPIVVPPIMAQDFNFSALVDAV